MSDESALAELAAVSETKEVHTVLHYLYAPSSEAASSVAAELQQRGFRTEERLGGDGVNWLVLARHETIPSKELMSSIRQSMEGLVANVAGEYDGWEAEVLQPTAEPPV